MTFSSYRRFVPVAALTALVDSAAHAQQPADSANIRRITVDGRAVRTYVAGLDARKPGSPVVVFESGAMNSLGAWRQVLPQLSGVPAVAYDRAGLGQSAWDGVEPTPRHVANRLRRLLQQIGAPPPYVLVGWSWGGSLARYFAGYYPGEVAGLVYVDPGPIVTQSVADEIAPFDAIGAGRAGYDAFWSAYAEFVARATGAPRAEFDVYRGLMQREPSERDLRPAPAVPAIVIIAAKPFAPIPGLPFDVQAHFQADVRHRVKMLQEWALGSPHGTVVLSNTTTHSIPRDDPDLIVWAIRRVLSAVSGAP